MLLPEHFIMFFVFWLLGAVIHFLILPANNIRVLDSILWGFTYTFIIILFLYSDFFFLNQ